MSTPANNQYQTQPTQPTQPPHGGLPFTGFDAGLLVIPAAVACIVGILIRYWATRDPKVNKLS